MASFIFCIVCGVWHFYNFITYIHPEFMLPFFRLAGDESQMLRVLNMLCLNWSPIIGGLLVAFGVVGIRVHKLEERNFESFKWFMAVVAFISSVGLML